MKEIKVIHLGVGGRGVWPVYLFKERKDFVSVAYVDVNKDALEKACSISGLASDKCFSTLEDALKKVEADCVFVITPPQLHAKQCLQVIEAGKHVLVEKPFALSLKEAKDIVIKAEKKNLKIVVAQNIRYMPVYRKLGELLKRKEYGRFSFGLMVKFEWRPGVHHSGKIRHSYLWERGVHDFDTILALVESQPRRIWSRSFNSLWSPYEHGAGTYTAIEFEDNSIFGIFCTFAAHDNKMIFQLECEKGSFEMMGASEIHLRKSGSKEVELLSLDSGKKAESVLLDLFYEYIAEGKEPPVSGKQNLKTIALVEAAGLASDEGRVIDFGKLPIK